MTTIDGLFAGGEANFSDHGANRLGASALMQGLADGYFILPHTVTNYLARNSDTLIDETHPEVEKALSSARNRIDRLLKAPNPKHSPDYFHQKLGKILWDQCGMLRDEAGLQQALKEIDQLETDFWNEIKITGSVDSMNQTLEKAGRVADFIELGKLMCLDALDREESCGTHARNEHLSKEGEAQRNDDEYAYVAAWEYVKKTKGLPNLHKEILNFEFIQPSVRNYK